MTQIKKFAWYGSSVAVAALLAVALLVTGPVTTVEAADTGLTVTTATVGGTAGTVAAADTDLDAGEIIIFTIIGGTGTGSFTSNGGQTIACADDVSGAATPTTCDRNTAADTVTVQVTGATAGSVLVRVEVYDGADGAGASGLPTASVNGSYLIATVTINNPISSVALTRTPTGANATGGTSTITATVTDSAGANATAGTNVTFQTSHGTFDQGCNTGTGTQVCVGRVATDDAGAVDDGETAGQAIVRLLGGGLAGTATITASVGSVTGTTTVVLAGAVDSMAVKFQSLVNAVWVDSSTPAAAATGASFRISVTPRDSAGNRVAGVTSTVAFSPAGCAAADAIGDAASTGTVDELRGIDPALAAGTTCTVTVTSNNKSATATFTVGAAVANTSVLTVNAPAVALVSVSQITVDVKSTAGVPVVDGTQVTLVVTGGAIVDNVVETLNGVATFQYVSPGTAQTVNATALLTNNAGTPAASAVFSVGGATPPPAGDGSFTGTIAESGVSLVVFDGGTVADLAAAGADNGLVSISLTVDGEFVVYIVGAPAFVNAAFNAAFPDGIEAGTPVIVKK